MSTYPMCYLVNDRPVMIVRTPDGGADCVVLDWASGSFVPDRSYFARTVPGEFKDLDSVTASQMDTIVAGHRALILRRLAARLAAADAADAAGVLELLGLSGGTPPFDAEEMEPTAGPGLLVRAPQLLRRHDVDAALGTSRLALARDGALAARYRVAHDGQQPGGCAVLAVFPSDARSVEAVLVQLTRVDG